MRRAGFLFLSICIYWSFFIDASVGSFQQVEGSPFLSGPGPFVAFSPLLPNNNLFAATANSSSNNISVYQVNPTTGFFAQVDLSTAGNAPVSIAFSPIVSDKLFAAVANFSSNNISVYQVNKTTGIFTQTDLSSAGINPTSIAFSPVVSGYLFAAVANLNGGNISFYLVHKETGEFELLNSYPVGANPQSVAISPAVAFSPELPPSGFFIAVANANNTVTVYKMDTASSSFLLSLAGTFPAGASPSSVAFSPLISNNLFAAVANQSDNTVSIYQVDKTTGIFTQTGLAPTGLSPAFITFSPVMPDSLSSSFAAVANSADNTVTSYIVDKATGAFTQVDVASTGIFPQSVAFSPVVLNNLFAAVGNTISSNVSVYTVTQAVQVTSITPANGPEKGGTTVIISGSNFANPTAVHFGTAKALFESNSDTQITAISPAGTGTVDVTVTTIEGTSPISPEDQFTYTSQSAAKSNGESSAGFSSTATHMIAAPGLFLKIPLERATYRSKVARRRRNGSVKITCGGTYHLSGLLHHTSPTPVNFVDNRAQLQHCLLVDGNCVSTSIAQTEWGSPPLDNNRHRHTSHSRCTCFLKKGAIVSIQICGSKDAGITPSQAGTSVILSIERATRSSKKR